MKKLHDRLKSTIELLSVLNERNQILIKQSLEMIDFDINLLQSLRTSPGAGQYNIDSEVEIQGMESRMFDTKR